MTRVFLTLRLAVWQLALAGCLPAAHAADTEQMIRDAVSHHDQQEYSQAIELLEQVLELEPDNATAFYELAFSHQASGDLQSCIDIAANGTRRLQQSEEMPDLMGGLATMQASCQSGLGRTDEALETFRAALEQYPADYGLNFNISITLFNTGQLDEAIVHLERAMVAAPFHPSAYYVIGSAYQQQGQRIPAMLAFLNFLQLEYNTSRSEDAAASVINLALSYETRKSSDDGSSSIQLSENDVRGSPDIMTLSLALSVTVMAYVEDGEIEPPVSDSLAGLIDDFIGIVASMTPGSDEDTVVSAQLMPGVGRVAEAEVTAAFAHYVTFIAGVRDAEQWLDNNPAAVDDLVAYLNRVVDDLPVEPQ